MHVRVLRVRRERQPAVRSEEASIPKPVPYAEKLRVTRRKHIRPDPVVSFVHKYRMVPHQSIQSAAPSCIRLVENTGKWIIFGRYPRGVATGRRSDMGIAGKAQILTWWSPPLVAMAQCRGWNALPSVIGHACLRPTHTADHLGLVTVPLAC